MPKKLQLREINENEQQELQRISRSRTEAARRVERAKIILALGDKERVATIAERYRRRVDLNRMYGFLLLLTQFHQE